MLFNLQAAIQMSGIIVIVPLFFSFNAWSYLSGFPPVLTSILWAKIVFGISKASSMRSSLIAQVYG